MPIAVVVYIAYLLLGIFQIAAIMAGLEDWVGLHWILSIIIAAPIAYIPILGTIVGMFGAVEAWHWSWLQATGLFFGPLALIFIFAALTGALSDQRAR